MNFSLYIVALLMKSLVNKILFKALQTKLHFPEVTKDYRFHAAHPDRVLMKHEAVPGGFNRAGEVYDEDPD